MLIWMIAMLRAALEMGTGIGLYCGICGKAPEKPIWKKVLLLGFLAGIYVLEVADANLVGTGTVLTLSFLNWIWLWLWTESGWLPALIWSQFYKNTFNILKMVVLLAFGIAERSTLKVMNLNPALWARFVVLLIITILFFLYWYWQDALVYFFCIFLDRGKWLLLFIGQMENALIIYLMNLVILDQFSLQLVVFNVVGIAGFALGIAIFFILLQYRMVKQENQMIHSKEMLIQSNYELLKKEYEKSSRISHEHKQELRYLYNCVKEQNWNACTDYLEKRMKQYQINQRNVVWTGYGSVDFMINSMKERAEQENIAFTVNVDMTEIPVPEYDFFAILGNLLDNAFEAAEKCFQNRYVMLKIQAVNDMVAVYVENRYEVEPVVLKGRFLTSKEEEGAHGWGIENVREIVKRNQGSMEIDYKEGIFLVNLLFEI